MRLRARLLRRLRQLLPPGLAGAALRLEQGAGWPDSPFSRLELGAAARCGRIRLELDEALAAAIRQRGDGGLPDMADATHWSRWQPLGHCQLRFKAVSPEHRQVLLLDALHRRLWLLWRDPDVMRSSGRY